jgi:CubicO group peptidase (beta-lactamase class C family)
MRSIVIVAVLAATPVFAQDKSAEIDKIFAWTKPTEPGCAVAVSHNGKQVVDRAYGLADMERDVKISPQTLFDAGSIRKQFVAASIFLLAEDGKLSVSDDVRKHVPELPDYGSKITLDHLLTHTSGIRDWTGLLNLADGDMDAWTMILRQRGLNFAPGEEMAYSNSGFVLLTEIVARVGGMPFSDFARKRLFEPLEMKATVYVDDMNAIVRNRALAYEKDRTGVWNQSMLLGNERGGGGALFTTAGDLLIWNDALTNNRVGASVSAKLVEPGKLNNGRTITTAGHGLFMQTYRGAKEIWYSGSAAGYKGWLGRYPEQGLSIAMVCNSGDGTDRTSFAHRIVDLLTPVAGPPEAEVGPPPAVEGDALADVNGKAGLFFNEQTGDPLRLTVDRNRFRVAAGPGLVPIAPNRYRRWGVTAQFMSEDKFELNFLSQDQFELKSMEGKTTRYRRAIPYTPTESDLKALAGRYQSEELKAVIHVALGKAGLMGRINEMRGEGLRLTPVERDTFQLGPLTLRFQRDKSGKVIGLDFSNPILTRVRFTQVSDPAAGR